MRSMLKDTFEAHCFGCGCLMQVKYKNKKSEAWRQMEEIAINLCDECLMDDTPDSRLLGEGLPKC